MKYYEPIWNSGIFRNLWDMDDMDMSENFVYPPKWPAFFFGGKQIILNHGILGYPFSDKTHLRRDIWSIGGNRRHQKNSQVSIVKYFSYSIGQYLTLHYGLHSYR